MRKSMHYLGSTIDKKRQSDPSRDVAKDPICSIDKDKPQFVAWLDRLDGKLAAYKQKSAK